MENEKEVKTKARWIVEYFFGVDCSCEEERKCKVCGMTDMISEELLAHGQSCYENGRLRTLDELQSDPCPKCGAGVSFDCYSCKAKESQEELTNLKAKAEKLVEALTMIASDYAIIEHAFPLAKEALKTWNGQ